MSQPLRARLVTLKGHERWSYVADPPPPYLRRVRTGHTGIDYDTEVPHTFGPGQEIRFKMTSLVISNEDTNDRYANYEEVEGPYTPWEEITKQLNAQQAKKAAEDAANRFIEKHHVDAETQESLAALMKTLAPNDYESMNDYLERLYALLMGSKKTQKAIDEKGGFGWSPAKTPIAPPGIFKNNNTKKWELESISDHQIQNDFSKVINDDPDPFQTFMSKYVEENTKVKKAAPPPPPEPEPEGIPEPVQPKRRLMRKADT